MLLKNLKHDFPSGLTVFLVAVPLCLGIATASGVPVISGIISAIIGGLIVGLLSPSSLSVSGPAAGLTIIVLQSIHDLGGMPNFLLALFFSGLIQVIAGIIRAGSIADYIPSSVVNGMLASIGLILISKELHIMLGMSSNFFPSSIIHYGALYNAHIKSYNKKLFQL